MKTINSMGVLILLFITLILTNSAEAAEGGMSDLWVVSIFTKGGPMMWAILLCSIITVAISIERAYNLQTKNIIDGDFVTSVQRYWQSGDHKKALKLCENRPMAISRILRAGLLRAGMGILEIERAVEGAGSHESAKLSANLRGLGVIANIAPMLGLLGTVAGMIKAFNVISTSGTGNPSLVASGISEALITTAAGLIIGIPTLALYHFFKGRVDKLVHEMEAISISFIEEAGFMREKMEAQNEI